MDGTIYLGNEIFPYTLEFLDTLQRLGISRSFLTNNPSKSLDDYVAKLHNLGIKASREDIYTTASATVDYIKRNLPSAERLFILGTPSLVSEFEQAGFTSTADDPDDVPDAIVASFDMTLTYSRLCRAAWWIAQGLPYIATNPDRVCPTEERTVLVDCGSICKSLESATGRLPQAVLGKPEPEMLYGIMQRHGLAPDETVMVGDRLYTDMEMATRAGIAGILVLSGETTAEMLADSPQKPSLVLKNIGELGNILENSRD